MICILLTSIFTRLHFWHVVFAKIWSKVLQAWGPTLPLPLAKLSVRESCQNFKRREKKRRSCTYRIISGTFCPTCTRSHLDTCNSLFFYTYRLILCSLSVLQFFKLLFSLANHCRRAVLLTVFCRKQHAKSVSVEKWKSDECRSYLFCVSMKLQFQNTWITLTSSVGESYF